MCMPESMHCANSVDLFHSHIMKVRQFLNQSQCNRLAKLLAGNGLAA